MDPQAQGRKRCRRETRRLAMQEGDASFKKLRILKADDETARVRVVDGDGTLGVMLLVKTPRGWLLDGIAAIKELGDG